MPTLSSKQACACGEFAGQPKVFDHLSNVVSIEWAGRDALIYTQPDTLGRPFKVLCMYICPAIISIPALGFTSDYMYIFGSFRSMLLLAADKFGCSQILHSFRLKLSMCAFLSDL